MDNKQIYSSLGWDLVATSVIMEIRGIEISNFYFRKDLNEGEWENGSLLEKDSGFAFKNQICTSLLIS